MNHAKLTALVSSVVVLTFALASVAGAASVGLSIPDTSAAAGDTLWVPIYSTDVTDSGVYSYSIIVAFDSTFVEMIDASSVGTMTQSWGDPYWNVVEGEDSLRVASAGAMPVSGEGALVFVQVVVLPSAPTGSITVLEMPKVLLNEGAPAAVASSGLLTVSGGPGGVPETREFEEGRLRIERPTPFEVRWHLDSTYGAAEHLKIYDASGRLVRSVRPVASEAGTSYTWHGINRSGAMVAEGIYFYHLAMGRAEQAGKVCIVR